MSHNDLSLPDLRQIESPGAEQLEVPFTEESGLTLHMGAILTLLELELASAVFSPIFYVATHGSRVGKSTREAFRHFVAEGLNESLAVSPLFDPLVYAERSRLAGYIWAEAETPSLFHWLRYGMARRIVPSAFFDEAYYQTTNPDVAASNTFGFVHFLLWGMQEGRLPNAKFDVAAVQHAALPGTATWSILDSYVRLYGLEPQQSKAAAAAEKEEAGQHAAIGYSLAWRWRAGSSYPYKSADPLYRYFEKIDFSDLAVVRWAKLVTSCWPLPENLEDIEAVARRVRVCNLFDPDFYRAQAGLDNQDQDQDLDPALHYVLVGEALGLQPSAAFDPAYYARRHPDVMQTGINMLLHYIEYGRAEGRFGHAPSMFHTNPERFDPARENVIVVVHETSRTGAPILGWNIVQHLAARYNVFTIRLGDGALTPAFEALSAETHGSFPPTQRHPVDIESGLRPLFANRVFRYAIINSSESRPLVEVCARYFVPTLLLMHEFGSYVQPAKSLRNAFDWATEIVFPAPLVARASYAVHPVLEQRTIRILPQGMSALPPGNAPSKPAPTAQLAALAQARAAGTFLVLGAGTVDLRKGVDLFLSAAATARRTNADRAIHFIWVGHGYRPDKDMGYSIYLQEQLQRSDLEGHVTFLGEVSDLEPVYALADAFFLSSRLDPLPNVSIDAACRGIPIVCFQDASGTADLLLADPLTARGVVPHLDADAAGRCLAHLASDETGRQRMAEATAQLARTIFDMDTYVEQLDALGTALTPHVAELRADAETLLLDDSFDPDLFLGLEPILESRDRTIARYLALYDRDKVQGRKIAPGFNPFAWVAANPDGFAAGRDPLANFIRAGHPAGLWQLPALRPAEDETTLSAMGLRALLHVHLPDPDLVVALLSHLAPNILVCDLLVSTDTNAKAILLQQSLADYEHATIRVQVSPGDLLSLHADMGADLDHYDVIGHVMACSEEANDLDREFQWQSLLGGRHAMRDRILDAFAHQPRLGLVFPADPRIAEWDPAITKHIAALAARIGYAGTPLQGDFPYGGMAWMRRAVLEGLSHLSPVDPEDDIPTLERLLPIAAEMMGLSQAVAHVPGVSV